MNALARQFAAPVVASLDPFDPRNIDRVDMIETQRLARVDDEARSILADSYEHRGLEKLADTTRRRDVSYASDPKVLAEIYAAAGREDVARLWRDELPKREHRTRKRVDKMTTAESAQMKSWADKWIKIGLSTERADRPLFEAAVTACYRYSGLAAPKAIVWAPCPIVVAYAGSIANAWLKANWDSLAASRRQSEPDDSVGYSVGASVRASVGDSVGYWHLYQGGQFWVGWGYYWRGSPSYVSFMLDVMRLDIGRDQELKARAFAATHESSCWWWPHRDYVIVSERPTLIEKHSMLIRLTPHE